MMFWSKFNDAAWYKFLKKNQICLSRVQDKRLTVRVRFKRVYRKTGHHRIHIHLFTLLYVFRWSCLSLKIRILYGSVRFFYIHIFEEQKENIPTLYKKCTYIIYKTEMIIKCIYTEKMMYPLWSCFAFIFNPQEWTKLFLLILVFI